MVIVFVKTLSQLCLYKYLEMKISVAIVEDDENYNNTLRKIINFQEDMFCAAQFFNGKEARKKLQNLSPDVVLMDIQLQDMLGINIIEDLKDEIPNSHFIMCTSFEDDEKLFLSLQAGATGYLIKGESMERILNAIREIKNGGAPMSFSIAKRVLQHFQKVKKEDDVLNQLTKSELEILEFLAKGLLYKEIADKKCISIETVKKHISNIYRKLQVNNKVEAVNKFNQK